MVIRIYHTHHWDWVPVSPENPVEEWEEVRYLHPQHPQARLVRRLFEADNFTTLEVDDESAERMVTDYALAKYGKDKPTRRHFHELMQRHVYDTVHQTGQMAPFDKWTRIECADDTKLEAFLNEAFFAEDTDGE